MTYEGQEGAYNPAENARDAAEQADYVALHGEECSTEEEKHYYHMAGLSAERVAQDLARQERYRREDAEQIGTNVEIEYRWMQGYQGNDIECGIRRFVMPKMAALEMEHFILDESQSGFVSGFEPGPFPREPRVQISRITLSKA